ncbi:Uncharacterized membrane-anchored protein [Chitinophaga sp. YR627]|uniref:DUF2167 domain-containing protein n=1 Tax=Chitinophaga sp. YR627 TaxID=1881041 RepID=UPI0008EAB549|nr:DUF2167 domain-containing protein [Chitinophaga sp. YR627]SFO70085.1 Uncharacterized membrane-anchored protein [Chitinophaga sp. YR627]
MLRSIYVAVLLLATIAVKAAGPVEDSTEIYQRQYEQFADSVRKSEKFETGLIHLPGGKANIDVPEGFKFLNREQSQYVLTTLWGNPPENAKDVLGMIFPAKADPFTEGSYAFIVEFEEIGYVKDDDAGKIDYDEMLKNMQADEKATNEERAKNGYSSVHIVGWAQKPFYDAKNKVLHWAKEVKFGDEEGANTLNYNVRILGRHGVLSLNAICTMDELPLVKANINQVLHMAKFTDGNTYFDFDPKIDQVAAWTIGGLVAGKILAKVGFFAIILKFLVAGWKFVAIGFAALIAFLKNLFTRRRKEKMINTEGLADGSDDAYPDAIDHIPVADAAIEQTSSASDKDPTTPTV